MMVLVYLNDIDHLKLIQAIGGFVSELDNEINAIAERESDLYIDALTAQLWPELVTDYNLTVELLEADQALRLADVYYNPGADAMTFTGDQMKLARYNLQFERTIYKTMMRRETVVHLAGRLLEKAASMAQFSDPETFLTDDWNINTKYQDIMCYSRLGYHLTQFVYNELNAHTGNPMSIDTVDLKLLTPENYSMYVPEKTYNLMINSRDILGRPFEKLSPLFCWLDSVWGAGIWDKKNKGLIT